MSETDDTTAQILRGAPYHRPETPGFYGAVVGGGPIGQVLSVCAICAAMVPDTDEARTVHDRFHQYLNTAIAVLDDD